MTIGSFALHVVTVEKRSSISFLNAVFDLYERGEPFIAVDRPDTPLPAGIAATRYVACPDQSGWFTAPPPRRSDDAIAHITLTSGTTGASKAIALSHRALADVSARLIAAQGLDASVREYVGVPVTFSFGLGRIRAVATAGGASFLPARGFRVDEFAAMLERDEVNALAAVPTLLRLILAHPSRFSGIGEKLKWLEIGSQAMRADEKQEIARIFPNARIIQHYGLTEASRTTFLNISDEPTAHHASVGRANGDVEIRITAQGRIAIRGPHVASGIISPDGLQPLADSDGWLVTSDMGRIEDGLLYFEGRADDLVNIGGIKVPAEQFEEKLLARLGTDQDIACAAGNDTLLGQRLVVAYPGEYSETQVETLRGATAAVARDMNMGDGFALFAVDDIPRTPTHKILRREISRLYAESADAAAQSAHVAQPITSGDAEHVVKSAFHAVFGARTDDPAQSFLSLNGDSLQYVNVLLALETAIPRLPEEWDALSIAELIDMAHEQQRGGIDRAQGHRVIPANLNSVRGLACVMIVALHVVGVAADEGLQLPLESMWHSVMNVFTPVRLPLFTALSGFLYAAMPATRGGFAGFARRKLEQLLLPLLFATIVFWGLRKLAFGDDDSLFWAYVDGYLHLWYIDALLLIFLVAAFIDTRITSRTGVWWAILAVVPFIELAVPDWPVLHIKNAIFLFPFFGFGILLYRKPELLRSNTLAVLSLVTVAPLLATQFIAYGASNVMDSYVIVRWLAALAAIVAFLRFFPRVKVMEWLAIFSFTVYLWHPAASGLIRTIALEAGIANIPLLFAIGLAAGLVLPVMLHRAMQRLPKLSPLFIGR